MAAIRFLTSVARGVHHALFGSADVLKQICENIVIPNVQLREEDEELFDMNYVDYIRCVCCFVLFDMNYVDYIRCVCCFVLFDMNYVDYIRCVLIVLIV